MTNVIGYLSGALPILPSVLVILIATAAARLARRLLRAGPEATTRGDFRLQLANLTISLLAVIAVVVVLPVGAELRASC